MTIKNLFVFSVLIVLFSCKPSNPETILGIKLGLPAKAQIADAIQAGKIKIEDDKKFVDYGNIKGYLITWTATNSDDIELLTGMRLMFVNPSHEHPNPNVKNDEWVSEFDMNNLIETYEGKYGKPELKKNNGWEKRIWKKGDLEIELSSHKETELLGKAFCNVTASYFYKKSIKEKMEEEEKKNKKSI